MIGLGLAKNEFFVNASCAGGRVVSGGGGEGSEAGKEIFPSPLKGQSISSAIGPGETD